MAFRGDGKAGGRIGQFRGAFAPGCCGIDAPGKATIAGAAPIPPHRRPLGHAQRPDHQDRVPAAQRRRAFSSFMPPRARRRTGAAAAIWAATGLDWKRVSDAGGFQGQAGAGARSRRAVRTRRPAAGGSRPRARPSDKAVALTAWTDRGGSLAAKLAGFRAEKAPIVLDEPEATPAAVAELAAGLRLRHYRFDKYKAKKADDTEEQVADGDAPRRRQGEGRRRHRQPRPRRSRARILARQLVNEPPNALGPVEFADEAQKLAGARRRASRCSSPRRWKSSGWARCSRWRRGSARPARLVVMQWKGGKTGDAPCRLRRQGRRLRYRRHLDQAGGLAWRT